MKSKEGGGGGGFEVEFVSMSSSLSTLAITSVDDELAGGLEVGSEMAMSASCLPVEATTPRLLLLVLKDDNDKSDEVTVAEDTLDEGFSNEAKISALSRYSEVSDEAADWKANQLSWSSAWLVF